MIDGFSCMSTHLGHVIPKRTIKIYGKMRQNITPSVDVNLHIVRFKACIVDLNNGNVLF